MTDFTPEEIDAIKAESARAYELDRAHVFHSWSAQAQIKPMVISRAKGSYVWDGEGNKYIDFSSQLVNTNIGHQHPKVVQAIKDQADKLCTVAPAYVNDARSEAARLITNHTPDGLDHVFFTNAGAEANEHAIRMARLHTGKHKVLSRYRSYHGATSTAINLTGDPRRWANDRGDSGVVHFFGPFLYRSEFNATTEAEETERSLRYLDRLIALEGPDTIAAIILEPIPGTAGIMVPPPGYLQGVKRLCEKYNLIFIADEVMSGFGRAGSWFAIDQHDVVPDILTFAKGVNSGYVPLGGVAMSNDIFKSFADRVYPGGLTYSGHPLATAAAVATITAMEEEGMIENAKRIGEEIIGPRLREFAEKFEHVGEVRGTGAFWAIEIVKDKESKEPAAPYGGSSDTMNALVAAAKSRGLLPFTNYHRVHVVPPLNISDDDLRAGLDILETCLAEISL